MSRVDSAGYDLAMGFHHGGPAGWSVALGPERYRLGNFRYTRFLLIEPGSRGGRVSLGAGSDTGGEVAAIGTNIRASYLRIREPRGRTAAGDYGGVEVQLILLGVGPRAGLFMSALRHTPIATIDFSLAY